MKNFHCENHENHYHLWNKVIHNLEEFKAENPGKSFSGNERFVLLKHSSAQELYKSEGLKEFSYGIPYCYACEEAMELKLKFDELNQSESKESPCKFCPITWYNNNNQQVKTCISAWSEYDRILLHNDIDRIIELSKRIRDKEWKTR